VVRSPNEDPRGARGARLRHPLLALEPVEAARAVFLREAALGGIGDRLALRDPAGRAARPHLVPAVRAGEPGLLARGPFLLHLRYVLPKEEGIRFCRATGDDNEIHAVGDVVPGAMTAAKVILPVEVLFPDLEVRSLAVKFMAIARYGGPVFTQFRCVPREGGVDIFARTMERGAPIAEIELRAEPAAPGPAPEVARRKVNVERLRAVRAFIQSLAVAPHVYFRRASALGYYYPRAFLAALPSGAMVRQLRGEGGLLNKLALEFEAGSRVPITGREGPSVEIERPKARRTFNKIVTAIRDSLRTYVRGSALVLSGDAASRVVSGVDGAPPAVVPTA
jgi:hypothetical protein